jgi:OmcA/MtrC family decaheme c-type cytochrome
MLVMSFLSACEGDDGATGTAGPQGPQGPAGPTGPTGPSGGVPIDSTDKINIEVASVTVPAGGGAPVVEILLTNDLTQGLEGLPATDIRFALAQLSPAAAGSGGSSEWQSYATASSGGVPNAVATTETATAGTFVENGGGSYSYTFAQALTAYPAAPVFDMNKTHRIGVEIRGQAPTSTNGILDFVPAGGAPTFERKVVDNDTCNACHDRLEFHGGPRTDVEYCVTCHNPYSTDEDSGNSVDMKVLIHNIHAGRDGFIIIGHGNSVHDYSDIEFPQNIRNCQTCHEESDANTPQASNWRLVPNREACGTCHYDNGVADGVHEFAIEDGVHPGGFQFNDDTQCVDCHGPNGTVTNAEGRLVQVAAIHEILEATAAEAFEYEVVSISNTGPGQTPTASIRVLNPTDPDYATDPASTAYDINAVGGPFQNPSSSLRIDIAWNNDDFGNVDPNDTLARPADSGAPFQPIAIDFKTGASNDGNNVFTKAASVAIPTGIEGSGTAILEGRPQVPVEGVLTTLAVTADGLDFAITDATAVARRNVVDIDKCNDCHKNLSLHGNNRTGNTELCSTCHNPNATDIQRRVAGSACDIALGTDDDTIDMKRMIHMIHAGAIGLCGFGNSAHDYFGIVYPGHLNNCEGCHLADTYYPVDPGTVMATTIDVGPDRSSLLDDVAISPNTAVCSSCHLDALAAEHMKQNGGDFAAGKDDTGAIVSSGVETCALCHGPGRSADVAVMHSVGEFEFN